MYLTIRSKSKIKNFDYQVYGQRCVTLSSSPLSSGVVIVCYHGDRACTRCFHDTISPLLLWFWPMVVVFLPLGIKQESGHQLEWSYLNNLGAMIHQTCFFSSLTDFFWFLLSDMLKFYLSTVLHTLQHCQIPTPRSPFYFTWFRQPIFVFLPESLEIIATAATHSNSAIRKSVSTDVVKHFR